MTTFLMQKQIGGHVAQYEFGTDATPVDKSFIPYDRAAIHCSGHAAAEEFYNQRPAEPQHGAAMLVPA